MACLSAQRTFHGIHPFSGESMDSLGSYRQDFTRDNASSLDFPVESRPPMPVPEESGPSFLDQLVEQVNASRPNKANDHVRKGYESTVLYCNDSGEKALPVLESSSTPPKPKPRRLNRSTSPSDLMTSTADLKEREHDSAAAYSGSDEQLPRHRAVEQPIAMHRDLGRSQSRKPLMIEGVPTQWFHGAITRKEAEVRLQFDRPGSFLIRIGERHLGYSLSVRTENGCKHYIIRQPADEAFQLGSHTKVHRTVHDLVEFFYDHPLSANGDGLLHPCSH